MKDNPQFLAHPFPPVYDESSRILILGSFPSVRSREEGFYYGHPRNRFWPLLARCLEASVPVTVEEKRQLLLRHHIALWDVLSSCQISGSSDSSIRHPRPNDLQQILRQAPIRQILCNGATAGKLCLRHFPGCPAPVILPSTSPANAVWTMERLYAAWKPWLDSQPQDMLY